MSFEIPRQPLQEADSAFQSPRPQEKLENGRMDDYRNGSNGLQQNTPKEKPLRTVMCGIKLLGTVNFT